MKRSAPYIVGLLLVLLAGCQTRSISDSGYDHNPSYRGELSELAVLGVNSQAEDIISDEDIQAALNRSNPISLKQGDKIVLVQSGAVFPDELMMEQAKQLFVVVPLSGVPDGNAQYARFNMAETQNKKATTLDRELRYAAAQAGARTLIVYWGFLESEREGNVSKSVSWVPIVGSIFPDEKQHMRIRLKAAVIDVATGGWELLMPEVYADEQITSGLSRERKDQDQVALLKAQAYKRLIEDIQTRYLR